MIIQKIKIKNYKTYRHLELDLGIEQERSIVLIGGSNGGGKTTLFEAICGALYGLKVKSKEEFDELLNDGGRGVEKPEIVLEVCFTGQVLEMVKRYVLKRTYILNDQGEPVESVMMNMDGNVFVYGTATPYKERKEIEQQVNKIIKANLPQELSKYFLFDAMQSSELLKKNVFGQIIRDNIENVMGFKKYVQLQKVSERMQQEWGQKRLEAEQEAEEYDKLCKDKESVEHEIEINQGKQDEICKYLANNKELYEEAKNGAEDAVARKNKIENLSERIDDIKRGAADYVNDLKKFMESMDVEVFLPIMVNEVSVEVEHVLRHKEQLKREIDGAYSENTLRDITGKVIEYMKAISMCNENADEENVVNHLLALQRAVRQADEFQYLNDAEVDALRRLMMETGTNNFMMVNRMRQDVEIKLDTLESLVSQKKSLEKMQTLGNAELVVEYEGKEKLLEALKDEEKQLNENKKGLDSKIHKYDIQIQSEPDVKYDMLVKLKDFYKEVSDALLKRKKAQIEAEMLDQLNKLLLSYKDCIAKVVLSDSLENFSIHLYHKHGNEISLNQLNAASKQIFIQVLLKVLRNLGDYNPPVMIDTVMGVLDEASRDALMEEYFPQLAEQTILLCTTSEIRKDSDYKKLEPFVAKSYTLKRDPDAQETHVESGYFGITLTD